MFRSFGRHVRTNIVGYLALVVAMSGASYAVTALPKNSVGAKQIAPKAVRSSEVRNRSLLAKNFKRGQVPRGPQGPSGVLDQAYLEYRYDRDTGFVPRSLPNNGTLGDVVSLSAGPGLRSGRIKVDVPSRLFVNVSAYLHNGDGGAQRSFQCVLDLRPVGGVNREIFVSVLRLDPVVRQHDLVTDCVSVRAAGHLRPRPALLDRPCERWRQGALRGPQRRRGADLTWPSERFSQGIDVY